LRAIPLFLLAFGCGRSDLVDELYLEPGFYDASDFDVDVGDDATAPDASHKPDAGRKPDARPPVDARPPPRDSDPVDDANTEDGPTAQCDPMRCATGCCYGDICAQGTQDIACGIKGVACVDCTRVSGEVCVSGFCVPILK
jgi:hypothetical protein